MLLLLFFCVCVSEQHFRKVDFNELISLMSIAVIVYKLCNCSYFLLKTVFLLAKQLLIDANFAIYFHILH